MAKRDLTGAVDFAWLEDYAAGERGLVDEVLGLFEQQAALWRGLLASQEGRRDAAHTLKGAARGIGAMRLASACERVEDGAADTDTLLSELDAALLDIAAYRHQQALDSLKS